MSLGAASAALQQGLQRAQALAGSGGGEGAGRDAR